MPHAWTARIEKKTFETSSMKCTIRNTARNALCSYRSPRWSSGYTRMCWSWSSNPTAHGEILNLFAKRKGSTAESADDSVGRRNQTRNDEGKKAEIFAMEMQGTYRSLGGGEGLLYCDPGSELRPGERKWMRVKIIMGWKIDVRTYILPKRRTGLHFP